MEDPGFGGMELWVVGRPWVYGHLMSGRYVLSVLPLGLWTGDRQAERWESPRWRGGSCCCGVGIEGYVVSGAGGENRWKLGAARAEFTGFEGGGDGQTLATGGCGPNCVRLDGL